MFSPLPGLAQAEGPIQVPAPAPGHPKNPPAPSDPGNCLPLAAAPELQAMSTPATPAALGKGYIWRRSWRRPAGHIGLSPLMK